MNTPECAHKYLRTWTECLICGRVWKGHPKVVKRAFAACRGLARTIESIVSRGADTGGDTILEGFVARSLRAQARRALTSMLRVERKEAKE